MYNNRGSTSNATTGTATPSQAWAILKRHARDEIARLRLQELCRDNDRVSSLVTVHNSTHENTGDFTADDGMVDYSTAQQFQDPHHSATGAQSSAPLPPSMLMADLSRQRMTLETLHHLLRLARSRRVTEYISRLSWGPHNDPNDPIVPKRILSKQHKQQHPKNSKNNESSRSQRSNFDDEADQGAGQARSPISTGIRAIPSYHLSLRAPKGSEMLLEDGTNAVSAIHREWQRMRRIAESIRRGQLPGVTGQMLRDVVVVGRGVSVLALRFAYEALCKDSAASMGQKMGMTEFARLRERTVSSAAAAAGALGGAIAAAAAASSAAASAAAAASANRQRRIKFITSCDPIRMASVTAELDPSTTMVLTIALREDEKEVLAASRLLKSWLLQSLGGNRGGSSSSVISGGDRSHGANSSGSGNGSGAGRRSPDQILTKHTMLVTASETFAAKHKPESVFKVPSHSRTEPFCNFTAATLLPLGIVFGWSVVDQFLKGGHDLDAHFVETNPRHNLPILLALTDIWNDSFLQSNGRVMTPYTEALSAYPAFCAALESQTCGNSASITLPSNNPQALSDANSPSSSSTLTSHVSAAAIASSFASPVSYSGRRSYSSVVASSSSIVLDGGLHHGYDRCLYQSSRTHSTELIMTLDPQISANSIGLLSSTTDMREIHAAQDTLVCSLFAHADELAFGSPIGLPVGHGDTTATRGGAGFQGSSIPMQWNDLHGESNTHAAGEGLVEKVSEGNRPSLLLLCSRLDAFACGQLIALAEHRAVVKSLILDIDPFPNETGSSLCSVRLDSLREHLSTMFASDASAADDDDSGNGNPSEPHLNLSTKTILRHYSNLMRDQRIPTTLVKHSN